MQALRVLIAVSDSELLFDCRNHLVMEGFVVQTTTSGLDCLARLRAFLPDLLVLDMDLPWGGGDGVLARLREECDLPQAPRVVLFSRSGRFGPVNVSWPIVECLADQPTADQLKRTIRGVITAFSGGDTPGFEDDEITAIESRIQSRLLGRVHGFRLVSGGPGLILRGSARTYLAKQLALQAVLELTSLPVAANEIQVN